MRKKDVKEKCKKIRKTAFQRKRKRNKCNKREIEGCSKMKE